MTFSLTVALKSTQARAHDFTLLEVSKAGDCQQERGTILLEGDLGSSTSWSNFPFSFAHETRSPPPGTSQFLLVRSEAHTRTHWYHWVHSKYLTNLTCWVSAPTSKTGLSIAKVASFSTSICFSSFRPPVIHPHICTTCLPLLLWSSCFKRSSAYGKLAEMEHLRGSFLVGLLWLAMLKTNEEIVSDCPTGSLPKPCFVIWIGVLNCWRGDASHPFVLFFSPFAWPTGCLHCRDRNVWQRTASCQRTQTFKSLRKRPRVVHLFLRNLNANHMGTTQITTPKLKWTNAY